MSVAQLFHRVSPAGEVEGEDPDKEEHPGPPGWGGLDVGQTTPPPPIKYVMLKTF